MTRPCLETARREPGETEVSRSHDEESRRRRGLFTLRTRFLVGARRSKRIVGRSRTVFRTGPHSRRRTLRSVARVAVVAAIGAVAVTLGLRRRSKSAGYCHRAGRCGGCDITAQCDVYRATHAEVLR
jgi:hypothetical protein